MRYSSHQTNNPHLEMQIMDTNTEQDFLLDKITDRKFPRLSQDETGGDPNPPATIPSAGVDEASGYRFIDLEQLQELIDDTAECNACHKGRLSLKENYSKRSGWSSTLMLFCDNIKCSRGSAGSKEMSKKSDGKVADVNRLAVLAMRSIGQSRTGAAKFSGHMDLPPPVSSESWSLHSKTLRDKADTVVQQQMRDAALRLKRKIAQTGEVPNLTESMTDEELQNTVVDVAVSCDGSWSSRGMSASSGIVSVVSVMTGEVLDYDVMTRNCPECTKMEEKDKESNEYMEWSLKHIENCPINHRGSASSMEAEGVKVLFKRSIEKHNLRYTTYLGDGDSKAYKSVVESEPYGPDVIIQKKECIGHMQNRMGKRFKKLVERNKGKKLEDGKLLSGKGRFTTVRAEYMQSLYGKNLRSNVNNSAQDMSKGTMAILNHYSDPADHSCCPEGPDSFCSYKRDPTTHIPISDPLPPAVVSVLKPIFDDLSDPKLLEGCIGSQTQNSNEALHSTIWRIIPKELKHSFNELELGVALGILQYNFGPENTAMSMLQASGLTYGRNSAKVFKKLTSVKKNRIKQMTSASAKEKRKLQRYGKRKALDAFHKDEGTTYQSGQFHGKNPKKQKTQCQCGSTSHQRITSKLCPMNRKSN